ncbi:MAG TPA: hypothetical protein VL576_01280 [Candidatus Paceibacterota bacterium]|jgi:hypothetical protein|nr:hypothetical protein [Candidatus Paceibacterota bacterium]
MDDYDVNSLKIDFPDLQKTLKNVYLTPILTYLIAQFLPLVGTWLKDAMTDIEWRDYDGSSKGNSTIITYVIDGKLNTLVIWAVSDQLYGLDYLGRASYPRESKGRYGIKERHLVRFQGGSSALMHKRFSDFVKQFDLKQVISDVLLELRREMQEKEVVDFESEPCIVELRKILADLKPA